MTSYSIIGRRLYIKDYLCQFISNDIGKLISEYDYEFKGNSYILGKSYGQTNLSFVTDKNGYRMISVFWTFGFAPKPKTKIWNLQTKTCDQIFIKQTELMWHDEFLTDGRIISTHNGIQIWNQVDTSKLQSKKTRTNNYEVIVTIRDDEATRIIFLCVLNDHNQIVTTRDTDNAIKIWNIYKDTYDCERTLIGHTSRVTCATFIPDGRIISVELLGFLKIWNKDTGVCELTKKIHNDEVIKLLVLKYNNNGCKIVSISRDYRSDESTVNIWIFEHGSLIHHCTLSDHHTISCIAEMPDGRIITYSYFYNIASSYMKIWDLTSGVCDNTITFNNYMEKIICIKTLPDGQIATCTVNGLIRIWN